MKVTLWWRHFGVYSLSAETEIPGQFTDWVYSGESESGRRWDETLRVHEEELIDALPENFLRATPSRILLALTSSSA